MSYTYTYMNMRSVVKKIVPTRLFSKIAPLGHWLEAVLFNIKNGFPARGLIVIGVTGTNGKTSTSFMTHKMLHEAGYKVGLMTTVAWGVGDNIRPQKEHMTSVGVPVLMKRLKKMKAEGMKVLVLEVTSHALAQHRVWGVPFSIAVLTNITHEHLDYHGTFDNYKAAKRKLFKLANKNRKGLHTGVINGDDENASYFAEAIKNPVFYGIESGDLQAKKVKLSSDGVDYDVELDGSATHIKTKVPGSFSVYNSLAVVGVGQALGLSPEQISTGIYALDGVEGRMTRIDEGQDFSVIVDYAHTPDSFEKIFKDLRPVVQGKLIVMFGSAGRRDEAKRAVQGSLAGEYADEVVITEEDDRDIDGQEIMQQIADGAVSAGKELDANVFMVHDRAEAIAFTLLRAQKGDTVLLLGKGHEKDILRPGPKAAELRHLPQDDKNPERVVSFAWDEIAETRRVLKKLR